MKTETMKKEMTGLWKRVAKKNCAWREFLWKLEMRRENGQKWCNEHNWCTSSDMYCKRHAECETVDEYLPVLRKTAFFDGGWTVKDNDIIHRVETEAEEKAAGRNYEIVYTDAEIEETFNKLLRAWGKWKNVNFSKVERKLWTDYVLDRDFPIDKEA